MGYEVYGELYGKGTVEEGEGCVCQAKRQNNKCMCEVILSAGNTGNGSRAGTGLSEAVFEVVKCIGIIVQVAVALCHGA